MTKRCEYETKKGCGCGGKPRERWCLKHGFTLEGRFEKRCDDCKYNPNKEKK